MKKNMEHYLSLGMDAATAEYFSTGRRQIVKVVPHKNHTLTLTFDNGEKRLYDVSPLFESGSVFNALQNPEDFCRVYLDKQHAVCWDIDPNADSKLVWNNKIDLCPDECYMNSIPLEAINTE